MVYLHELVEDLDADRNSNLRNISREFLLAILRSRVARAARSSYPVGDFRSILRSGV